MKIAKPLLLAFTALSSAPALAQSGAQADEVIVTGQNRTSGAATKTDTPPEQVPQPVTIISADTFEAQGAVSISDTLNYVAGVQANPYGPDSRVDGATIRGISALQFRDGMRDVFSYYASIRSDPYNFDSVQVLRGPSSVLFGQGSLGGIVNLNSKLPQFEAGGEVSLRYGSFDRKEALADLTGTITDGLAGRIVARVRDSGTQVDHVPDDRVMVAPSLTWAPGMDTSLTVLGLYQEDDSGSTSQFLPLVGTLLPNTLAGQLPNDTFVGKPGWDRYDGRLIQGTALFNHRFSDAAKISLKARYIDSDLTYFSHYPNSYSNPTNPYVIYDPVTQTERPDPEQRHIGLYTDASIAGMEIFTTDNNVQLNFNTGAQVEHVLLGGIDYSWNRVRKVSSFGLEYIDLYDIDYDAISGHGGGLPAGAAPSDDTEQKQLGFYLQDQIRLWDRVSVVLGVRRDHATSTNHRDGLESEWNATTFRAGIIGEVVTGVSPFFSYTESFEPVLGFTRTGDPLVPKRGSQYEAGIKFHPSQATMVTLTGYRIKEQNRPIDDAGSPQQGDFIQAESVTSKGVELEARTVLPGDLQLIANYSYNEAEIDGTNQQLDNVSKHNASLWALRGFSLGNDMSLRLGGGVRYTGENRSYGLAFTDGLVTPDYTLVDGFAELRWKQWSFSVNATNLLGEKFYSACLARGDCFIGAERNVYGTLSLRF
ncbi:TonB-dependent siderophore receptor [Sphingomonas xinjiangensis]|uniref:Iron complex outermembrane receptor protein n=1 Tax=Sphingomonas xinjiangensis TaxID=643568 RepID=A0A840YQI1_9SPHN|nr:TonB-dependent siderophore receptor [Sphingomonas xinjiangensis]MBB5710503.1 iron complex outermembrane receptor protein [Sphingomonas xinjiangensis]